MHPHSKQPVVPMLLRVPQGTRLSWLEMNPILCWSGNAYKDMFLSYVQERHKPMDSESLSCMTHPREQVIRIFLLKFRYVSKTWPLHLGVRSDVTLLPVLMQEKAVRAACLRPVVRGVLAGERTATGNALRADSYQLQFYRIHSPHIQVQVSYTKKGLSLSQVAQRKI